MRGRIPLGPAATALAIENVLYTLSAAAMIAAGMVALLFEFQLPPGLRRVGEVDDCRDVVLFGVALWLLWRQPALVSRALLGLPPAVVTPKASDEIEDQIYGFVVRHRSRGGSRDARGSQLPRAGRRGSPPDPPLLHGSAPALLTSFILETTNRLIQVVFKFVPLRLGVDEAGTAVFTQVLGLGSQTGVTLAIVRKARVLFWTAAGAVLLLREGLFANPRDSELRTDRTRD